LSVKKIQATKKGCCLRIAGGYPSFSFVSPGLAGRTGKFCEAAAQEKHFRSLPLKDEALSRRVSKLRL